MSAGAWSGFMSILDFRVNFLMLKAVYDSSGLHWARSLRHVNIFFWIFTVKSLLQLQTQPLQSNILGCFRISGMWPKTRPLLSERILVRVIQGGAFHSVSSTCLYPAGIRAYSLVSWYIGAWLPPQSALDMQLLASYLQTGHTSTTHT